MQTDEYITGWRGVCVAMGLGKPYQRALCATVLAGVVCFSLKYPQRAFREDGSMRPMKSLSMAPDAADLTNHYLLTPLAVGSAVYLFS